MSQCKGVVEEVSGEATFDGSIARSKARTSRQWPMVVIFAVVFGVIAILIGHQAFFLSEIHTLEDVRSCAFDDFDAHFDGHVPRDKNISYAMCEESLHELIDSKPYGSAMTTSIGESCGHYFRKLLRPLCWPSLQFNGHRCCAAVRAFIDEGKCLCQPRVIGDMKGTALPWLIQGAHLCNIQLPLPGLPWKLSGLLSLEECQPVVAASTGGWLNPNFLQSNWKDPSVASQPPVPDSLLSFDDLFDPPSPGHFPTEATNVIVPRDSPSVLVNSRSSPMHFAAELYYPVDAALGGLHENTGSGGQQRVAKGGPFPILAFSPGYNGVPSHFRRTLSHIASQGFIVISQLSTSHLGVDTNRLKLEAWVRDIVYMLQFLIKQGKGSRLDGFLSGGVNEGRVGIAGHSFGAGMSIAAASMAKDKFGVNVTALVPISPACLIMGNSCEMPSQAAPKLHQMNVLFIVGSEDKVTPVKSTLWFHGILPEDTTSEVLILEGATHCLFEADPSMWERSNAQCGRGTMSPQESVQRLQVAMEDFLNANLVNAQ